MGRIPIQGAGGGPVTESQFQIIFTLAALITYGLTLLLAAAPGMAAVFSLDLAGFLSPHLKDAVYTGSLLGSSAIATAMFACVLPDVHQKAREHFL